MKSSFILTSFPKFPRLMRVDPSLSKDGTSDYIILATSEHLESSSLAGTVVYAGPNSSWPLGRFSNTWHGPSFIDCINTKVVLES